MVEIGGGECSAAHPAPVGRLANENEIVGFVQGFLRDPAAHDLIFANDSDGNHVDEAVVVVAGVENHVATEIRHTEGIAVHRDALHDLTRDLE